MDENQIKAEIATQTTEISSAIGALEGAIAGLSIPISGPKNFKKAVGQFSYASSQLSILLGSLKKARALAQSNTDQAAMNARP